MKALNHASEIPGRVDCALSFSLQPFARVKGGLLSAKGGLMMGTKKVGAFSSPHKKAILIITLFLQM